MNKTIDQETLTKKLQCVIKALEDVKARDIELFDTTGKTPAFARAVVCTGTSSRHARALGENVRCEARKAGWTVLGSEGGEQGDWVLVDLGDVVVHCLQEQARRYYALEDLWGPERLPLPEIPSESSEEAVRS